MRYKTVALIMAAGVGSRLESGQENIPKQYIQVNDRVLLAIILEKFLVHPQIDAVLVVINDKHKKFYEKATKNLNLLPAVMGGTRRQDSVRNGLIALKKYSPENILIHDAARIFVKHSQISQVIEALNTFQAVTLGAKVVDSLRYANEINTGPVKRDNLFMIQTPQAFKHKLILKWHNELKNENFTDDISIAEKAGCKSIKIIESSIENFKLTNRKDLQLAERLYVES